MPAVSPLLPDIRKPKEVRNPETDHDYRRRITTRIGAFNAKKCQLIIGADLDAFGSKHGIKRKGLNQ